MIPTRGTERQVCCNNGEDRTIALIGHKIEIVLEIVVVDVEMPSILTGIPMAADMVYLISRRKGIKPDMKIDGELRHANIEVRMVRGRDVVIEAIQKERSPAKLALGRIELGVGIGREDFAACLDNLLASVCPVKVEKELSV
jgi:hypothetical protein